MTDYHNPNKTQEVVVFKGGAAHLWLHFLLSVLWTPSNDNSNSTGLKDTGTAALCPATAAAPGHRSGAPCVRHGRLEMHSSKEPSHRGCLHSYPSSSTKLLAVSPSHKGLLPLICHYLLNMKADILEVHPDPCPLKGSANSWSQAAFPVCWASHHSFTERRGTWACLSYLPHTIFNLVRIKHDPSFWFPLHKQRLRGLTVTALHISGLPLSQTKRGTEREDKPLFYVTAFKKCKKIRTFKYYLKLCLPITVTHLSAAAS